jgi:dienelactone hydrolase
MTTCLLRVALTAAVLGLHAPPSLAQATTLVELPEPAGPALITLPDRAFGERPRGVVMVLPDTVGHDGRADRYAEALLAHGIAVLEVGAALPAPEPEALAAVVVAARQALARDPRFGDRRIALLGFGEGARAALAFAGALPVAALYPRCAAAGPLPAPELTPDDAPLLLLHPLHDASDRAGACERLVAGFGPRGFRHAYADTTPGWDIPPLGDQTGPTLQPRDAASHAGLAPGLRYRAVARPAVTEDAARRVAWFITAALERRGPWTPPAQR